MASSPFMESLHHHMTSRHYSKRTIDSYLYWIRFYIRFHHKRHPTELGSNKVMKFLAFLAVERHVSVATQKIALNALAFLSRLLASLLYGSGLRRIEAVRLRVNDVDFDHLQLRIWAGKGNRHRITTVAPELVPPA